MLQDKPQENIWYYLKRQCVDSSSSKSIRDSLTSSFSIFSGVSSFDDDPTTCNNTTGSYLANSITDMTATSDVPGSYVSVYGGSVQGSQTGAGSIYSSVYGASNKLTSIYSSTTLTADSYVKDSFWKEGGGSSIYSIPSSAAALSNSNNSNSSNNNNIETSVSGYIDTFTDLPTPPQSVASSGLGTSNGSTLQTTTSTPSLYSGSPYDLSFSENKKLDGSGGTPSSGVQSYLTQQQQTANLQDNTDMQKLTSQIQDNGIANKSTLPWNESFQELLDRPVNSHEEERVRNLNISHFSQILANTATKYVKTLVQEVHITPELKSIKPFEAGGFAGGEKFRIDNMFIKFALNPHQIYERSNPVSYFANKAAGHELKSINALVSCGVPNLHFPLMCLLNYRGFRLIVISELPINSGTLVFGSSNAGETIKENETVLKMMVKIGEILNLKTHLVEERGKINSKKFTIPLAIDIEGHFGYDGRYYVVDTARLFPPETPILSITGGHLYRLFRPEFVKKYETQLCSDAFAAFNVVEQEPYNDEATKANNYLIKDYIPMFLNSFVHTELKKINIKSVLHREGVNLRYLGLLLYLLTKHKGIDDLNRYRLQGLLTVEMLARLVRFILFTEMRQINSPDDKPHLEIVTNHLNLLLTEDAQYWSYYITNSLVAKYSYTLTTVPEIEKKVETFIRDSNGLLQFLAAKPPASMNNSPFPDSYYGIKREMNFKYRLLKKIIQLTGFNFDEKTLKNFKNKKVSTLFITDIISIDVTVKHMDVSSSFKTFENFGDAENYYLNELQFKSNQLGSDHCQVAITHVHLAELYETYSILTNAEQHYKQAVQVYIQRFGNEDIGTANAQEKLALCNIKQKKYKEASENLEQVLKIKSKVFNKDSIEVADTYDNLAWSLQSQGEYNKSLTYYNQALTIKLEKGGNQLSVAKTLNNLGHLLLSNNDLDKSLDIFKNVLDIFVKQYGSDHSDVAVAIDNIALVYAKKKNYAMAEKFFNDAIAIRIKQFGEDSRFVALTKDHLAQLYVSWGTKSKHAEADRIFRECIQISEKFPDQYLKGFLRYNYSKLFKKKKDKVKESEYLTIALQIFEGNKINTDLTTKIKTRLEQLKKSGFTKFKEWFNAPVVIKKGNNDIMISQHTSGHMAPVQAKQHNDATTNIPPEWQAILQEAGITEDIRNDPKFAQTVQSLIVEEMENNDKQKGFNSFGDVLKKMDKEINNTIKARPLTSMIKQDTEKLSSLFSFEKSATVSKNVPTTTSTANNSSSGVTITGMLHSVQKEVKNPFKASKKKTSSPQSSPTSSRRSSLQDPVIPQLFPQKSPADISPIPSPSLKSSLSDSKNSLSSSSSSNSSELSYSMEKRSRVLSKSKEKSAESLSESMKEKLEVSPHYDSLSQSTPTSPTPKSPINRSTAVSPLSPISPLSSSAPVISPTPPAVALAPPAPITSAAPPPPPSGGSYSSLPMGAAPPIVPQPSYLLPRQQLPAPPQHQSYYPTQQHYPQQYPTTQIPKPPAQFSGYYPTTTVSPPPPPPRQVTAPLYPGSAPTSHLYPSYATNSATLPTRPITNAPTYPVGTSAYHTTTASYQSPSPVPPPQPIYPSLPRTSYIPPPTQQSYLYQQQQPQQYSHQYPVNYYQQPPPQQQPIQTQQYYQQPYQQPQYRPTIPTPLPSQPLQPLYPSYQPQHYGNQYQPRIQIQPPQTSKPLPPPPTPLTMAQLYPQLSQANLLGPQPALLQQTKPSTYDSMIELDVDADAEDDDIQTSPKFESNAAQNFQDDADDDDEEESSKISWPSIQQLRTSDKDRIIELLREKVKGRQFN